MVNELQRLWPIVEQIADDAKILKQGAFRLDRVQPKHACNIILGLSSTLATCQAPASFLPSSLPFLASARPWFGLLLGVPASRC